MYVPWLTPEAIQGLWSYPGYITLGRYYPFNYTIDTRPK